MSIINLENVHRSYEMKGITVEALRGISISVKKGEFAALAGPSG